MHTEKISIIKSKSRIYTYDKNKDTSSNPNRKSLNDKRRAKKYINYERQKEHIFFQPEKVANYVTSNDIHVDEGTHWNTQPKTKWTQKKPVIKEKTATRKVPIKQITLCIVFCVREKTRNSFSLNIIQYIRVSFRRYWVAFNFQLFWRTEIKINQKEFFVPFLIGLQATIDDIININFFWRNNFKNNLNLKRKEQNKLTVIGFISCNHTKQ